jgi:nucleolar complex protein 3
VNIEFFRDLLIVLKSIVIGDVEEDEEDDQIRIDVVGNGADVRLRLLAIVTAFDLLSGQGKPALDLQLIQFDS